MFADPDGADDAPLAAIGHCRLVTHGSYGVPDNNQPVVSGDLVGVHNGIVANADRLVGNNGDSGAASERRSVSAESWATESDTRILYDVLYGKIAQRGSVAAGLRAVYGEIEGHASIAFFAGADNAVYLATDSGSLYLITNTGLGRTVFASEKRFLADFAKSSDLLGRGKTLEIQKINPRQAVRIPLTTGVPEFFSLDADDPEPVVQSPPANDGPPRDLNIVVKRSGPETLKRCSKCVLPETYPFIRFDENGVCTYCLHYERQKFHGRDELERILSRYRAKDGSPDVLVGLSGGRDSCYGLHVLKTEFGMNPVAYTFDWGLTTDTSRRNQARICGKLGVEHIIRAPDIAKKRRSVRKNVEAWLKRPSLGMVLLFMAGDKEYYHYGRKLKKELGVGLTIQCAGNRVEQSDFQIGFCGVGRKLSNTTRLYSYPTSVKARLAWYYIKEYLLNPSYINESFFDSIWSFFTCFLAKDDFLYLFEYLPWNEKEIEALITKEYNWEAYRSYGENQWRMGDGQTAFTNYIWYTVAGFSEFDNFRSHQVRDGMLTREEAVELTRRDNEPKFEALEYFAHLIGFNLDEVLARINSIPKLY